MIDLYVWWTTYILLLLSHLPSLGFYIIFSHGLSLPLAVYTMLLVAFTLTTCWTKPSWCHGLCFAIIPFQPCHPQQPYPLTISLSVLLTLCIVTSHIGTALCEPTSTVKCWSVQMKLWLRRIWCWQFRQQHRQTSQGREKALLNHWPYYLPYMKL